MQHAKDALKECDLLIVMGSSLVVQPANKLPTLCLERNVPMVIVNQTETKYDPHATLVINEQCGAFMKDVMELLQR